jgi:sulfide:quinone oxidoreductase
MRESYAAVWRAGEEPESVGELLLHACHLELRGRTRDGSRPARASISLDGVGRYQVDGTPRERLGGLPALVIEHAGGPDVRLAVPMGVGALHELAHELGLRLATRARPPRGRPLSVVIAGGGVAGLEAALALRAFAGERVAITLLSARRTFDYRPLAVRRPFEPAVPPTRIDLAGFAEDCGARLVLDELTAVETGERTALMRSGRALPYDTLLLALGARSEPGVPGAVELRDSGAGDAVRAVLGELQRGEATRVVFALPGGAVWPLPLYELALLTAAHAAESDLSGVALTVVTPEEEPLGRFGHLASEAVCEELRAAGIELLAGALPVAFEQGMLRLVPHGRLPADRVVSVPRLAGPRLPGVPHDEAGFVPTDPYGHVGGRLDVFAAGDATAFPVKQGGIAAQQAETAARAIAAQAGAPVQPLPFEPVLRGLVLTGGEPLFLRAEVSGSYGETSRVSHEPLWWPPGKIAGRYLPGYLAEAHPSAVPAPAAADARGGH